MMPVTGSLRRCALAALAVVAWLAPLAPPPAAGHEGPGALALVAAEPAGPMAVTYRVRLTFRNDGHPATDATVTAVAEQAGGAATTPQPMAPEGADGTYVATVRFPAPGTWTVRFTAVSPPATLERTEEVAPPPTTTTVATVVTATGSPGTVEVAGSPGDRDGGGGAGLGTVAAILAAALAVAAAVVGARRKGERRR